MERKRLKTHHDFDTVSTCSTDSHTLSLWSSDSEALFSRSDPLPRRASSLLSLPIEIRFLIYQYAFSSSSRWEELIRITVDRKSPSQGPQTVSTVFRSKPPEVKLKYSRKPPHHLPVALLRTCRQIYDEALPVLLSGVCFGFATKPTSLMFLLDRFSETAHNNVRYLHLYPAPLYVNNGPIGDQLSWAVLCARLAGLPSLRRLSVVYGFAEDLRANRVELHRLWYGKSLSRIRALKEPEFEGEEELTPAELRECYDRFTRIVQPTNMGSKA
ncbi:hypothetical protein BJX68DRAFT_265575 [Aspergillus pseudodeflectus]|uniref:DUF7730 domain-containing protein n=1 Tax=Aspergillus pseudodeflectus TaxID=176178 RepID=A0ABR4KK94_9EURO